MICLICRQAEIVEDFMSVKFERGEFRLAVGSVPARVCPSCGEAYVAEGVAVHLLQRAEEICKEGMLEEVIDYERL